MQDHELEEAIARARAEVEALRAEHEALEAASPVPGLREACERATAEAERLDAEVARVRQDLEALQAAEEAAWQALQKGE